MPDVGRCRPRSSFNSVVLPPPEGPVIATKLAGLDIEVDVLEDELVGRAVAKAEVAHLDRAFHVQALGPRDVGFGDGGDDIRQAVEMQAEQTELHKLIDEADGAIIERLAKRQERKQHADGKALAGQDQACSEKDDDDVDQSGEQGLDEVDRNLVLADRDAGIGRHPRRGCARRFRARPPAPSA